MSQWTAKQGVNQQQAQQMIQLSVQSALDLAAQKNQSLKTIGENIATPGTYTKYGLDYLESKQSLENWTQAMDVLLTKLKKE